MEVPLGVVSPRYCPLQNSEAFDFFDPIIGEKKAVFETAGSLGNGERVWVLAKVPGQINVVGGDCCTKYLLLFPFTVQTVGTVKTGQMNGAKSEGGTAPINEAHFRGWSTDNISSRPSACRLRREPCPEDTETNLAAKNAARADSVSLRNER